MNAIGGYDLEDLSVGMSASFTKDLRERDIFFFGSACGDRNPIHYDEEFAQSMQLSGRIAHPMLTAAIVSTAIAARLPGPGSINVSHELHFKGHVTLGETVRATVTVRKIFPRKRLAVIETVCDVGGRIVLTGEAVVIPTSLEKRRNALAALSNDL